MREQVWDEAKGRCIFPTCRRFVTLEAMHAHEVRFRSLGGDPLDVEEVVCTCGGCHGDMHGKIGGRLKRITGTKAEGLQFFQRATGRDAWRDVTPPAETRA